MKLTPEQIAENKLAAVGHIDGKSIEYFTGYQWVKTTNLVGIKNFPFRRKPEPAWTLPKGKQWHRTYWTKDMLPDGWRPLLKDEMMVVGDEARFDNREDTFCEQETGGQKASSLPCLYLRTRRPLPSDPQPWSRPEHVPGPVCWIRKTGNVGESLFIVAVDAAGITVCADKFGNKEISAHLVKWDALDGEYSTDRINWKACTVEARP